MGLIQLVVEIGIETVAGKSGKPSNAEPKGGLYLLIDITRQSTY
jgi:hypothetical protein